MARITQSESKTSPADLPAASERPLATGKRIPVLVIALACLFFFGILALIYFFSPLWIFLFLGIIALGFGVPSLRAFFILHPRRTQPRCMPSQFGIKHWEEVGFNSPDGVALQGWFIPPDPEGDGATMVLAHGMGNNRAQMLPQAAVLVAKGYGALLFDLRNHGKSGRAVTTLGYVEAQDVRGAVDYVLARREVNADRIGLLGYSMGAVAVLRAAVDLPQVKAVVAEGAYATLEDNIADGIVAQTGLPAFPFAPFMVWLGERITGLKMRQLRPIDDVARIAPRPILFVHGEADDKILFTNSVKLHQAADGPSGLYLIPKQRHTQALLNQPQEYSFRVSGFIDWAVRGIERRHLPRQNYLA